MTSTVSAQMKVAQEAEKLARTDPLIDLQRPQVSRRVPLDEAIELVRERYSTAIELLGKL